MYNQGFVLILSALIATTSAAGDTSGYALVINHIPEWGFKKGGLGIGKSIRYDIRKYPAVAAKEATSLIDLLKASELPAKVFLESPLVPFAPFGLPLEKK
ncbi:uncharacterized protein TNIN_93991 [Trichonephila inaurata madagascariensis]|uniref:Uncharacterized protein n=1 Tax=Trichonephila inaurata madagascariensis TaxID=2747483 RepID=A0A8X6XDB1_9ARAC|nr:uncharacterized protein TNIN_93991 [Trichonephila inaurata madagascariensis]